MTIIRAGEVTPLNRGGGVVTIPLITRQSAAGKNKITSGISVYPPGAGAPPHAYRNTGTTPMTILLVYSSAEVTRMFTATGKTVEHLSPAGLMDS